MNKVGESKTADSNINNLWREYFQGRANNDGQIPKNSLIEFYLPLVKIKAERLYKKCSSVVDVKDLVQSGIFGLIDSIEEYDISRGIKFESYCSERITGAMLDEIREIDWVPHFVRLRSRKVEKAKTNLRLENNYIPNDEELIEYLANNFSTDKLNKSDSLLKTINKNTTLERKKVIANIFLNDSKTPNIISLDPFLKEDIVNEKSPDPLYEAQKQDLKDFLMRGLTRQEKLIIALYYFEKISMKEIGRTIDICESRTSQMHSSILQKLNDKLIESSEKHQGELELMTAGI